MAAFSSGCDGLMNDQYAAMREQWMVDTPPSGATPISEIKSGRSEGELETGSNIVIRARIDAGDMSPWTQDQAAFIVTDASGHDGDSNHNPHECPFCRRDIRDHIALVQFTAEDGRVVPVDARQLLGVAENELLVVQGTITEADGDDLVIDAQKLHRIPRN